MSKKDKVVLYVSAEYDDSYLPVSLILLWLKSVEEFVEYLSFGEIAVLELRMLFDIVHFLQILHIKHSTAIAV